MKYQECECSHCDQSLEYPVELCGKTIDCPNCNQPLLMPDLAPEESSFFGGLVDKFKDARENRENHKKFKEYTFEAIADGILEDEEIDFLDQKRKELLIDQDDVSKWGEKVFKAAVAASKEYGPISPDKEAELGKISRYFGISLSVQSQYAEEISRSRKIHDIQNGQLPPIMPSGIVLKKTENAYWQVSADLFEERVVNKRYEGGSRGVSMRVMKGVSFRVGSHSGQLVSEKAHIPVSTGRFVITDKRLIFSGDNKSFSVDYGKIIDIQPAIDGVRFSQSNIQKPRLIIYHSKNDGDLICEIISQCLSNYEG
jgi:hypothetical protein